MRADSDIQTRFRAIHRKSLLNSKQLIDLLMYVLYLRCPECRAMFRRETEATKMMTEQFPFRELLLDYRLKA